MGDIGMSYEKKVKDTQSVINFLKGNGRVLVTEYLMGKMDNDNTAGVSYSEMVDELLVGGTTEDNVCFDSSSIIRGDITEYLKGMTEELKETAVSLA